MAQPDYYEEGATPRRRDTLLRVWTKALGARQNLDGALSANNPRRQDTLRVIKQKTLNAINGTEYNG